MPSSIARIDNISFVGRATRPARWPARIASVVRTASGTRHHAPRRTGPTAFRKARQAFLFRCRLAAEPDRHRQDDRRQAERRVGKEWVSQCEYGWSQYPKKKKKKQR